MLFLIIIWVVKLQSQHVIGRLLIFVENLHLFMFTSCNHYLPLRHGSFSAKGGSNLILEDIVPKCWRNCLMSLWKCEGLPLAIVAIGGLLSTKDKTILEWQNLQNSLGIELQRNPHLSAINKILSLSFEDLPYNLKSFLLYLGMYPEDYYINCIKLIQQ